MLIDKGMDVNFKDENGETALHKGLHELELKYEK
jgi:ankyrin repeat protein